MDVGHESYSHEREVEAGIEIATRDGSVAVSSHAIYKRVSIFDDLR